jgi:glucose/arabinose dehydrogenase
MKAVRRRWLAGLTLIGALMLGACAGPAPVSPTAAPTATSPAEPDEDEEQYPGARPGSAPTVTPRPLASAGLSGLKTELIAEGLVFPSALAFAPDGRLFFAEVKKGALRIIDGRSLLPDPAVSIEVARGAEHGLVGVALDPDFQRNHYVYTYYTQVMKGSEADRPRRNRLTRWVEQRGQLSAETPILGDLPVGKCCHTGGKMAFAADGSLFLTVGDQGDADRRDAQNPRKLNGKLLHLRVEQVLREKPDPLSLIYASGLRNPYGLDVHPATGAPILTDNGPDGCDELNLAQEGANFGNPEAECSPHDPRFSDPLWDSGPDRLGLTGLRVYRGAMFPELIDRPLFCAVNTGNLVSAVLEAPGFDRVSRLEQVLSGDDGEGCRLDLAVAADGSIYYASTTRIYRLHR